MWHWYVHYNRFLKKINSYIRAVSNPDDASKLRTFTVGRVLRVLNVFRFLLSLLVFSELWKSTFSSSTLPYWFTHVVLFMCCLEPHGFTNGFTQLQPSLCPQQHGRTIQHGVECRTVTKSGRDCFRTTSTCHGVSCLVHWFNGFKTQTAPCIQTRLTWGQTYKIV